VLIHADREEMHLHREAVRALRTLSEGSAAWALPVFCIGELLRVVSHPRVFDPPTPVLEAFASLEALLESPSVRLLSPGPDHLTLLRDMLSCSGASGNLVFDAQIAAVGLEHGARTLLTEDRDFALVTGIQVQNLAEF